MNLIVFLDINGVLIPHTQEIQIDPKVDPVCMDNLIHILSELKSTHGFNINVVITSNWRLHSISRLVTLLPGIEPFLAKYIPNKTPRQYETVYIKDLRMRGYEIKAYIDGLESFLIENPINYVILDDDTDMLEEQQPHFVRIDGITGIQKSDLERILNVVKTTGSILVI